MPFLQEPPRLSNQYETDPLLKSYIERFIPEEAREEVERDLARLGQRVIEDILDMGEMAERWEPEHIPFDGFGRRVDRIVLSPGWQKLKEISAEEGLVALGYKRPIGEFSRIWQFAKIYLFTPSSAIYTCPLAMTDGAAKLIEVYGDEELKREVFPHLTSQNPKEFWISGQWMTEKTGGSDVSRTETIARKEGENYRLFGEKWFTSAMPSEIAMTLARIEDEQGRTVPGSRGLSLFYVRVLNPKGQFNQIEVLRLKDKLGTRALPTAEIQLQGTPAKLIGEIGRGVKQIAALFNITRMYNACSSVSFIRRVIAIARDYAQRREAFGRKLSEHPLHLHTLAEMEVELHAAFHLAFYLARLLGKVECQKASPKEEKILRILTPLAKLYTAKQAIQTVSEGIEALGGAGYLEDVGVAKYLRDTQVLSIWEGTTNVLSLDVLRAMKKEKALEPLLEDIQERLERLSQRTKLRDLVLAEFKKVQNFLQQMRETEQENWEFQARSFSYSLCRLLAASLMLEHSEAFPKEAYFFYAAKWWCTKQFGLAEVESTTQRTLEEARTLALAETSWEKVAK